MRKLVLRWISSFSDMVKTYIIYVIGFRDEIRQGWTRKRWCCGLFDVPPCTVTSTIHPLHRDIFFVHSTICVCWQTAQNRWARCSWLQSFNEVSSSFTVTLCWLSMNVIFNFPLYMYGSCPHFYKETVFSPKLSITDLRTLSSRFGPTVATSNKARRLGISSDPAWSIMLSFCSFDVPSWRWLLITVVMDACITNTATSYGKRWIHKYN